MMKIQLAAALCLVLLVASEVGVIGSEAANCNAYQLLPCLAASKNSNVKPSSQCCTNIISLGQGMAGANCLCSLLNNSLVKSQGVVARIALGIPLKCRNQGRNVQIPRGFVCQGIRVPGS